MASGWTAAPPPGTPPLAPPLAPYGSAAHPFAPQPSGLLKAARILLLVGAILSAVGAVFMIAMTLFIGAIFAEFEEAAAESGGPPDVFPDFIWGFYGIWGLLSAGGAVCGFVGYGKANRGDLQGGFVWGLVGSLLPPINILTLLGAIFCKTCPEAEAAARAAPPTWPPQAR